MTKQEILDRIWNILNQGIDTESGDLDLLRHDLEQRSGIMDYKKIIEDRIKHFESIQPKQHSDESRATVAHIIFELKDLLKKGVA